MENIINYKKLENFPFEDIIEIGSLFFYEESLCSLLISSHGLFVIRWVELDEDTNLSRWMLFKINFDNLVQYINNELSSLELIKSAVDNNFLLLDIDANSNYVNILEIDKNTIPKSYLPNEAAIFVSSACPDIEIIKQFVEHNTKPYPKQKKTSIQVFSDINKKTYTNYHSTTHFKQYVGQN